MKIGHFFCPILKIGKNFWKKKSIKTLKFIVTEKKIKVRDILEIFCFVSIFFFYKFQNLFFEKKESRHFSHFISNGNIW